MFISKFSGRTSMELTDTYRTYAEQLHRNLSLLDGVNAVSYLLYYAPDAAAGPTDAGIDTATYEQEYLQGAGKAEAMVIEVRRREPDGKYHQYVLGRPDGTTQSSAEVSWGPNAVTVPANEVFAADEAAGVFFHYFEHRTVPGTYSLRELDFDPVED